MRLHALKSPVLRCLSGAAYAAPGPAPGFAKGPTRTHTAYSPFLYRCTEPSALPAAVHQHDETLPYRRVPHRQLDLAQRHFSPAARQLHSQSFAIQIPNRPCADLAARNRTRASEVGDAFSTKNNFHSTVLLSGILFAI